MIRLNHDTLLFRMIHRGKTVARVEELELVDGRVHRGYNYRNGKRVLEGEIPA